MHPPQNLCLLAREAKALAIGDPAAPAVRASILALATARCDDDLKDTRGGAAMGPVG